LRELARGLLYNSQGRAADPLYSQREVSMLWTIFMILLILWFLGMVSSYTLGGFIHILLVVALVVLLVRIIQGSRPAV
jgi:hypothetical protein